MERHRHGAPGIGWMNQHMMAANDPVNHKPCPPQRRQNLPCIHGRQRRAHAATVTIRSLG